MKKSVSLLLSLVILLCGCSQYSASKVIFTKNENGNIVSSDGVEYAHLANEGILYYLGELEFVGRVKGEKRTFTHMGDVHHTGMYTIKNIESDNILIRTLPDNEWRAIYRKASLPEFNFSVDNCVRLELVSGIGDIEKDVIHTTCGDGITNNAEISEFLSEVRKQKSPTEAGLYDLVRKPGGGLENCYMNSIIYGFFKEEPNVAVGMPITSYNDLAYSVSIEGKDYVLPASWFQKLKGN